MLPCLILAGGLGTRLRPVLGDALPKAMASIAGQPFLSWMLRWLCSQGATEVVISVGYGRDLIKDSFRNHSLGVSISYVEEDEPLGTGGAIMHALKTYGAQRMIVMNGDTLCNLRLRDLLTFFDATSADLVVAATKVPSATRYGKIEFDARSRRLSAFDVTSNITEGFINAGVYAVDGARLLSMEVPQKFSLERDLLRRCVNTLNVRVFPEITEFIDIGIPSDYNRAQSLIPRMLEKPDILS